MKVQAIIPTAGLGTRLKSSIPKPMIKIKGKPLFIHTLQVFENCSAIDGIILVVSKEFLKGADVLVQKYRLKKVRKIVAGGKTRQQSVYNGVMALDPDTTIAVVHDGARPCVRKAEIEKGVKLCQRFGAVTLGVPVKYTIKSVNPKTLMVEKSLERSRLWEIQTPQIFRKELLVKAHQKFQNVPVTDDAALVERLGKRVRILPGQYNNIKITTPEDLVLAKKYLQ